MLPTYSSELNPVEHVWSLFKNQWSRYLTSVEYEANLQTFIRPRARRLYGFDVSTKGSVIKRILTRETALMVIGRICKGLSGHLGRIPKANLSMMLDIMQAYQDGNQIIVAGGTG